MQKQIRQVIRGMQRDLSISKSSNEYSYENYNIRVTPNTGDSLLSVTNEKGTKEVNLSTIILGDLLGYCVLNQYLVVFTKYNSSDMIYRINYTDLTVKILYNGNINFNAKYPIETLGVYENENIQKIYWVDKLNQPRFINIMDTTTVYNKDSFDFVSILEGSHEIYTVKNKNGGGEFPGGVIQYALTYFNDNGQQSNIFYISDLLYSTFENRAASPEEKVNTSFSININYSSTKFDYIRIYSIFRTSLDATPTVKVITDIATSNAPISYTDTGNIGYTIDPTELLFMGGEPIIAGTMAQKDNTLFLGNITLQKILVPDHIKQSFLNKPINKVTRPISPSLPKGYYSYFNRLELSSSRVKHFKYLEHYRLGVQLLHKSGKWSEAIFISDQRMTQQITGKFDSFDFINLPAFELPIDNTIVNTLMDSDYIGIRPLVVFPSTAEREIVTQGILCPTIFEGDDRKNNGPFVQSSWFTRPLAPFDAEAADINSPDKINLKDLNTTGSSLNSRGGIYMLYDDFASVERGIFPATASGAWAEFRHNTAIPSLGEKNAEIQYTGPIYSIYSGDSTLSRAGFYVDQSIVTMHSPDIELSDSLNGLDNSNLKLRIVGMVPITSSYSDMNVTTSTPFIKNTTTDGRFLGFYKPTIGIENISRLGWKTMLTGHFWFDGIVNPIQSTGITYAAYHVYPWHRNGSLNNSGVVTPTEDNPIAVRTSMLDKKKLSVNRYSYNTMYLPVANIWNAEVTGSTTETGISGAHLFNSNETEILKLNPPKNSNLPSLIYSGNIDKVVLPGNFCQIIGTWIETPVTGVRLPPSEIFKERGRPLSSHTTTSLSTDPVSMKYKSTKHIVIPFNYTEDKKQIVLPTIMDINRAGTGVVDVNSAARTFPDSDKLFWDRACTGVHQPVIAAPIIGTGNVVNIGHPYLWLGELYRENVTNRFGGTSEEAINNNIWYPCGDTIIFRRNANIVIRFYEGDTYYSRYDCLKTYPFTLEDQNSIVDIVSFMCESRVNPDARYDRNRGNLSNLTASPTNFNLMNPVYNQKNNFFTYRGLDSKRFSLNKFPNTVTWSKEKQSGSIIDTWTNITMANTLDLDGDKGEVTALTTFNNEIFCFQDRGLSNILFNSRVQIPTSDGVPIEISNGMKVQGKRYISNHIGCMNKWSIMSTPNGIYFIDPLTNGIYLFNGQIKSLSDELGFRNWISENNSMDNWDSVNYSNFRTFYDSTNSDIYFNNKDVSLCFSELIHQFTSFMSYNKVPAMFNINNKFFSINKGKLWEHEAGDYNIFYEEYKPYYMTYRLNPSTLNSVIFNNIEYRSITKDICGNVVNSTFDLLEVWNEYQKGVSRLNELAGRPSNLKQKLRVWKALIPRDQSKNNRDRIHNPWIHLKLTKNNYNTDRMEFHDLTVDYFE